MTVEEVDAVLVSTTTVRDLAILLLMLDGGLRPGEVLCPQPEDVAYGRRRVTIRKRDDHPRGARAKGRRERVVELHEPRTWTRSAATSLMNVPSRQPARSGSSSAVPARAGVSR
jgi:integrase